MKNNNPFRYFKTSPEIIRLAVMMHVGFSHEPERDEDGKVFGGRLLHMGRDTSWGCALRNHFS